MYIISNMKSLIAIKFCIFLLIGTSLGQTETRPQIHVSAITIPGSKPDDQSGTLTQQGLKMVHYVVDPAANLAEEVGKWVLNASSIVEQQIVEAGKEAYEAGTKLGGNAMQYAQNVADAATERLGLSDSGKKNQVPTN